MNQWLKGAVMALTLFGSGITASTASETAGDDPYLWLENVDGDQALDWVRARNAVSQKELEASADFKPIHERLLKIYDSNTRIPFVTKIGPHYYNFWRDAKQVRGVWRRTSLAEYRKPEPAWETVLDLDALAASEKENWVWKGASCVHPDNDRCLLSLSRGGGDAVVIREFDITKKRFVADGFQLPEAKSDVVWADRDRVFVATDFGAGSLTDSGYPRIVREWKRGTPLADAVQVFAGAKEDVASGAMVVDSGGHHHELMRRATTFYSGESWLRVDGEFKRLDVPDDAQIGLWQDQLTVELRTDWVIGSKSYPGGSLLVIGLADFLGGKRAFANLYTPGARKSLSGLAKLKSALILNELDNVRSKLYELKQVDGKWTRTAIDAPAFGALGVSAVDDDESNDYWLTITDFLTPTSLHYAVLGKPGSEQLKSLPSYFDAKGLEISQHEVKSKDGTLVPYFQVSKKGLKLDGSNPTLLYGYGGFEVSMQPGYSAGMGAAWLERGGVYVLANIRGGGEFGPAWHQAALKANRQRAYDDFIAIAEDLSKRKLTSPKHLGIQGGSNGGLLMGVMLTQRPDLFGAVVCQVPLLDMRRYNQLLAGASWMGEYGNPDVPAEWAWISKYSPYQNLRKDAKYPRVLFTTSTRDDRVHPGHARKMAARMAEQGHDFLYYENIEGGHGGAANNQQQAYMNALAYTFFWKQLR
ncbi:prolyl oligopeptidase family serine peptidase [Nevskia ramosa]|uniref:prolyl oligopeptidase family serine peptidase n=1 Tax=Nevskia ramosa TaxID=64002 RepID=UPI003D0C02F9